MRPEIPKVNAAAEKRSGKFETQEQILARLEILRAMKFEKGERGIGARKYEIEILEARLQEMQNPALL